MSLALERACRADQSPSREPDGRSVQTETAGNNKFSASEADAERRANGLYSDAVIWVWNG